MKILHVINSLDTAGAERLVCDLAPRMNRDGNTAAVATLDAAETPFRAGLRAAGVDVRPLLPHGGSIYSPRCVASLIPELKNADIVHAHLFPTQYWAALARLISRTPARFVTTEHSTYNKRCNHRLTSWLDRLVYEKYDAIACISPAVVSFMKTRAPHNTRIRLITNGIDVQRFRSARGSRSKLLPDIPSEAFVLMQVGRFTPEKNHDCTLLALAALPEHFHVVFVGSGPLMERCRARAAELGVTRRAHFLGQRTDVPELLSVCDAAVLPSRWEGFGLAAAEAMAAGKPVFASRVEGLAQVVADERLLFDAGKSDDLVKKILTLCRNSGMTAELGQLCSRRAERFDISHTAEAYLELYREVIKES